MNASNAHTVAPDSSLETFAAELTEAVFPVALRYGVGDRWLDLELDLWRGLSETGEKGAPGPPRVGPPPEVAGGPPRLVAGVGRGGPPPPPRHRGPGTASGEACGPF